MTAARFAWLGLAIVSLGCVEVSLREARTPMDYAPIARPEPQVATEGAVWRGSTSSGSFLFYDRKARGIGDLVTVMIVEDVQAAAEAKTETDSERSLSGTLSSDVGFQSLVGRPIKNILHILGFSGFGRGGNEGTELNVIKSQLDSEFDGQGKTSRTGTFTGTITCRVVDVLPGGLFHIKGRRSVVINHEAQLLLIEALVRREDIDSENKVASTALAELRLSFDGLGTLDDKQRTGWLAKVFDWAYPF